MRFESVRGQDKAARMLESFLDSGRIPAALLFTGPPGVGKAKMAKLFAVELCSSLENKAAALKGLHPDIKFVDAVYQASLRDEEPAKQKTLRAETIRHLRQDMSLQSMLGSWKAAIIDEAHMLEPEAANALLKILEEPPPKTLWILLTSQRERVLKTIQSRCMAVPFAPLPEDLLREILESLGRDPSLAELAEGSVSRALSLEEGAGAARALAAEPLAAFRQADSLPRELYLARAKVEGTLSALAQLLRRRPFLQAERGLKKIMALRRALNANADPKLVLVLAGEAAR